jgi:hypothetical protein
LFPARLDEYVAEDNPVRAVDAFVDGLDLDGLGFIHVQPLDHEVTQLVSEAMDVDLVKILELLPMGRTCWCAKE